MVAYFPVFIGAGVLGVAGMLCFALGGADQALKHWATFSNTFKHRLVRADMSMKPEEFALIAPVAGALTWIALVLMYRPNVIGAALLLPASMALAVFGCMTFLRLRGDRRINAFNQQLELVLRMLAGALRVGLGLRQAVILVIEEVPDPARREFMRVVGRTNIGISILDALDELAKNMPSHEMTMFARTVRVQSQTGGDLAKVLETLATTIRDRRRVVRKMGALTAQGRFGAFIIGGMPFLVGGFVVGTQPDMAQALLHTQIGYYILGVVAALEIAAGVSLSKILQFDV
jgi:tight adherence protein B